MFGGNSRSMQMNWGNHEKPTSLITSACKRSEHCTFESTWLSTNVNDPALGWMEYWDCQVWHQDFTWDRTIWVLDTFFRSGRTRKFRHLEEAKLLASRNDAGIFNLLSRFQAPTPAKLIFLRTEKHRLAGIKIMIKIMIKN